MASDASHSESGLNAKPGYSVRVRLTLWYALVTLLILCLLGMSVWATLRHTLIANMDHDQTWGVNRFLDNASRAGSVDNIVNPRFAQRFQRPPPEHPTAYDIFMSQIGPPRVLDLNAKPLSTLLPALAVDRIGFTDAAHGHQVTRDIVFSGRPVRVVSAPILLNGHEVGVLQSARPLLDDVRTQDLHDVTAVMIAFIPFAVLISALGALFLTSRAIAPVKQIADSANQIGARNLSERLPVIGRDEFASLAMTFNGMLERLEDGFNRMEKAYEQQRRFTGDASHELRTPLTIIKANASLTLAASRSPEEYVQALRTIDSAADRTNRLIQDLLLLARADAGQLEIEKRPALVTELVETAISHIASVESGKGPHLISDTIATDLAIMANPDMIVRLLDNLISNAWRHTPDGGEVRVSAIIDKQNSALVRIRVADTGEGIAPEHLPFLTKRFYRAEESRVRTHGGTGLGLAICESIIDLHSGSIKIDSVLGKGTTVTVELPRAMTSSVTEVPDIDETVVKAATKSVGRRKAASTSVTV